MRWCSFVALLCLSGCGFLPKVNPAAPALPAAKAASHEHAAVQAYLESESNDPASLSIASVELLRRFDVADIGSDRWPDHIKGEVLLRVVYRDKNRHGALERHDRLVWLHDGKGCDMDENAWGDTTKKIVAAWVRKP